jgi:hypothetical protein
MNKEPHILRPPGYIPISGVTKTSDTSKSMEVEISSSYRINRNDYNTLTLLEPAMIRAALMHAIRHLAAPADPKHAVNEHNSSQLLLYRGNALKMIQSQMATLSKPYFHSIVANIACIAIFEVNTLDEVPVVRKEEAC